MSNNVPENRPDTVENWPVSSFARMRLEVDSEQHALSHEEAAHILDQNKDVIVCQDEVEAAQFAELLRPRPWLRLWARVFDYCLLSSIVSLVFLVACVLLPTLTQFFLLYLGVLFLAIPALWIPFEAIFLSAWGGTPGKKLLGLAVSTQQGKKISLQTSLKRSVLVWLEGMALGLPVLSWVAMGLGAAKLIVTKRTFWDAQVKVRSESRLLEYEQTLLFLGMFLVVALASVFLMFLVGFQFSTTGYTL